MKKELRELIQARFCSIYERQTKDGPVMNVAVPVSFADQKNQNQRIYPEASLFP